MQSTRWPCTSMFEAAAVRDDEEAELARPLQRCSVPVDVVRTCGAKYARSSDATHAVQCSTALSVVLLGWHTRTVAKAVCIPHRALLPARCV
jgi:hypothetical protein